jgi:uracil-DNA glycosylase
MIFLTKKRYNALQKWHEKYPNEDFDLSDIKKINYHVSWDEMFQMLFSKDKMKLIINKLKSDISPSPSLYIYPPPDLLFNAFTLTPLDEVKVVIIGQDPYPNDNQAMGCSFSVPYGEGIPSSLKNIYKYLYFYDVCRFPHDSGNLEFWALQGCLMLNNSLSVVQDNKNCHKKEWNWFTSEMIRYISDKKKNVVFLLWGADAYSKITLIDQDKHEVIISSHPSGFSVDKPFRNFPAFKDVDHFGETNKILKKWGEEEIIW